VTDGLITGSVTRKNVYVRVRPSAREASSSEPSNCRSAAALSRNTYG
jgi:hypothetical protein